MIWYNSLLIVYNLAAKCTLLIVSVTNFAEKSLKNPVISNILGCGFFDFFYWYQKNRKKNF